METRTETHQTDVNATPSLTDIDRLTHGMTVQSIRRHAAGLRVYVEGGGFQMALDIRADTLSIELKRLTKDGWRLVHR
jgi:hypothetical protein